MTLVRDAVALVIGLVAGSFLTVVVARVPDRSSVVQGRSRCDTCARPLGPRDLVPVAAWLVRRGRCRACGARIGRTPLLVELSTSCACVAVVRRFGVGFEGVAVGIAACALIAQSAIDLRTHRLPREISYTAFVGVVSVLGVAAAHRSTPSRLALALAGSAAITAALAVVRTSSRGAMGDGDVRLAPLLGVTLGWWSPILVAPALLLASTSGAVVGSVAIITGRAHRRTPLPFGPFLAFGTLATLWWAAAPTLD